MKYMQDFGYKVIPINPNAEGEIINGEQVVSGLDKVKEKIDIVDVFRPSAEAPGIAEQAAKIGTKVLWLQYGIHHESAEEIANKQNIREVTLFPMNQNAEDLMMGAPSIVEDKQLKEIGIKINKKKED